MRGINLCKKRHAVPKMQASHLYYQNQKSLLSLVNFSNYNNCFTSLIEYHILLQIWNSFSISCINYL